MSRFVAVILLPEEADEAVYSPDNLHQQLMAPYATSMAVEPYERDCPCVGIVAGHEAHLHAAFDVGTFDEALLRFLDPIWERISTVGGAEAAQEVWGEEAWARWEEVTEPIRRREAQLLEDHPLRKKPDPNCTVCRGTGHYTSHENPRGRWTSYEVGGDWHLHRRDGDAAPLHALNLTMIPFAVITPDGAWYQAYDLDLWGEPRDAEDAAWHRTWEGIQRDFANHMAIVVTCQLDPDRPREKASLAGGSGSGYLSQHTDTLRLLELMRGWEERLQEGGRRFGGLHQWTRGHLRLVTLGGMLYEADGLLRRVRVKLERLELSEADSGAANAAHRTSAPAQDLGEYIVHLDWYRRWLREWQRRREKESLTDGTDGLEEWDDWRYLTVGEQLYDMADLLRITMERLDVLENRHSRRRPREDGDGDPRFRGTHGTDGVTLLRLLDRCRTDCQFATFESPNLCTRADEGIWNRREGELPPPEWYPFDGFAWKSLQILTVGEMIYDRKRVLQDAIKRTGLLEQRLAHVQSAGSPTLAERARGCLAVLVVFGGGFILLLLILSRL